MLEELKEKLKQPKAPAMPCVATPVCFRTSRGRPKVESIQKEKGGQQINEERLKEAVGKYLTKHADVQSEWYACVHTPLPIPEAMKIKKAKEALETEWS